MLGIFKTNFHTSLVVSPFPLLQTEAETSAQWGRCFRSDFPAGSALVEVLVDFESIQWPIMSPLLHEQGQPGGGD
jgi:hypothetical protein